MKIVIKDQLSVPDYLKEELEQNSEKVNKEKSDEKKLISKVKKQTNQRNT